MKKLFFCVILSFIAFCTYAQNDEAPTDTSSSSAADGSEVKRGISLKEVSDFYTYSIGRNTLYSFTNRIDWFISFIQDPKADYNLEITQFVDDTTIQTLGWNIDYGTKLHKVIPQRDGGYLEISLDTGRLYLFSYQTLGDDKKALRERRKEIKKDQKKLDEYLAKQRSMYPDCKDMPYFFPTCTDRLMVEQAYFDLHHKMWRGWEETFKPGGKNDGRVPKKSLNFKIPQRTTDVVTSATKASTYTSIPQIIAEKNAERYWDTPRYESDSTDYYVHFSRYEGRPSMTVYYLEKGKVMETIIVPRPEAAFNDFSFRVESTMNVYQINFKDQVAKIRMYKSINGTKLTKDPTFELQWKADFEKDAWERIGKVDL